MGKIGDDNKSIEQSIIDLFHLGKLPGQNVEAETTLFRIQMLKYKTANHFHAPVPDGKEIKLGRFNDPLCQKKIWYGSELPLGALAEFYGRIRTVSGFGLGMVLNHSELANANMCEVKALRPLRLLNVKILLAKLGFTTDQITNSSYSLTTEITRIVSRLPGNPFDGIAYESRHWPDGRYCYALWIDDGEDPLVSEGSLQAVSDYVYRGELSAPYEDEDISAEEMLTEIMNYLVV
ncbi:RES domain-containing protein [Pseudomonas saxonica]|uniref:RES domain-containing protein n=1 Tax=Pseudomonas saxonica TaxID=2600598 RepID=A0ABY3GKB7_9PSED|nr:RES family NAD+ phosphorylase [Pseudomonas saxonica]TWR92142.1 RES domain-containing protein [Pseudomonas saxonica]